MRKSLFRPWLGIAAGAGLAALSIIPMAAPATASAAPAKDAPTPVVTGIVNHRGKAVYHAKVVLFAEPQPRTFKRVKKFDDVPMKIIGSGYTNHKGRYVISVTGTGLKQAEAYSFGKTHVVNCRSPRSTARRPTGTRRPTGLRGWRLAPG
jgi:hypothetical protein